MMGTVGEPSGTFEVIGMSSTAPVETSDGLIMVLGLMALEMRVGIGLDAVGLAKLKLVNMPAAVAG